MFHLGRARQDGCPGSDSFQPRIDTSSIVISRHDPDTDPLNWHREKLVVCPRKKHGGSLGSARCRDRRLVWAV